jgi:RecB family exonuclease
MIPTSLSATAMQTATQCLARYAVENIQKNRGPGSAPADLGTAVHGALEQYVRAVYMDRVSKPDLELLLDLFKMQYMVVFDDFEPSGEWYDQGVDMCKRWFERTDLSNVDVISIEEKTPFDLTVADSAGTIHRIPFNYIFDRLDQLDETTYRVVDYKTWRAYVSPEELRSKLQVRVYALACQIQFPHAQRIWVQLDQLRHDSVGAVFTKDDNANTWRYLKKWAKKILDTPLEQALEMETLNPDCKWCIRKASCKTLSSNALAGGVTGMPLVQMIDRRAALEAQAEGLKWAMDELDKALANAAKADDVEQLTSHQNTVYWTRRPTRTIERSDVLANILGPAIMERFGKTSVSLANVDKLLKGKELTDEQKTQLRSLITTKYGEPSLKIKPVSQIDAK